MPRRLAVIAAVVMTAAPAFAIDMPARKPGLWELKITFEGSNAAQVMKHCIDATTDKLMNSQYSGSAPGAACSKQDMNNSGGTITIDSVCKFGEATSTTHAVITGSFESDYTMEVTSTREGGLPLPGAKPGVTKTHMTLAAKHLGACAAGQRPGDVIMANGMTMNVLDLPKMGAGLPKRP